MANERQLSSELFGGGKEAPSMGVTEAVKEAFKAIAPGLDFDKIVSEVGGELKRLGVQGQMELAAALFGGGQSNVFVPYGPGQNPRMAEQSQHQGHGVHGAEVQREQPQQQRGMSL